MIKLVRIEHSKNFDIYIDGEKHPDFVVKGSKDLAYISDNGEVSRRLIEHKLIDFPQFHYLDLYNVFDSIDFGHRIFIIRETEILESKNRKKSLLTGKLKIVFIARPDLSKWNEKYSFEEYTKTFSKLWVLANGQFVPDDNPYKFYVETVISKFDSKICHFISLFREAIEPTHVETVKTLASKFENEGLTTLYEFPEEVKLACEQYLLYFARFLKDLGINVTSNLKEDAGKVLFSVTPTDAVEALDKIREALAVYLNLPASPIVYDDSFAAMRLKQQIDNLHHSQRMMETEIRSAQYALRLAQQNIENQDQIILRQSSLVEQQNKLIEKITSKSIMMDSVENKEELEEIYDGVKVGESETLKKWLGISLNPAKAIKTAVKNTFGKDDDKKSILGLDEE